MQDSVRVVRMGGSRMASSRDGAIHDRQKRCSFEPLNRLTIPYLLIVPEERVGCEEESPRDVRLAVARFTELSSEQSCRTDRASVLYEAMSGCVAIGSSGSKDASGSM